MQDDSGIVAVAVVLGAVDPVAVTEFLGQAVDADMPVVAGAIQERVERDLGMNLAVAGLREDQPDRRPVPADQHEIDSAGRRRSRPRAAGCRGRRSADGRDSCILASSDVIGLASAIVVGMTAFGDTSKRQLDWTTSTD